MSNANLPPDEPDAAAHADDAAANQHANEWAALDPDGQQGGDASDYSNPDPFGQAEADRLAEREQLITDLAAKADGSVGISVVLTNPDQQRELNDALRQADAARSGGTEYAQGVGSIQIGDVHKSEQDAVQYLSFSGKERTGHEVLDFSERKRASNEQQAEERVRVTYAVDGAVFDKEGHRLEADDPREWRGTSGRPGNHFGIGFDLSPDDAARLRQATENDPTLMRDLTDRIAINRGIPEDMWRGSEDKAGLRPPYERMFGDEPRLEVQGEAAKRGPEPGPAHSQPDSAPTTAERAGQSTRTPEQLDLLKRTVESGRGTVQMTGYLTSKEAKSVNEGMAAAGRDGGGKQSSRANNLGFSTFGDVTKSAYGGKSVGEGVDPQRQPGEHVTAVTRTDPASGEQVTRFTYTAGGQEWNDMRGRSGNLTMAAFEVPGDGSELKAALQADPTLARDLHRDLAIDLGVPQDVYDGRMRPPYDAMYATKDKPAHFTVEGQDVTAQAASSAEPQQRPITDTDARRDPPTVPKEPAVGKEQGAAETPQEFAKRMVEASRGRGRTLDIQDSGIGPRDLMKVKPQGVNGDGEHITAIPNPNGLILKQGATDRPPTMLVVDNFSYKPDASGRNEAVAVSRDKQSGEYEFSYSQLGRKTGDDSIVVSFKLGGTEGGQLYDQLKQQTDPEAIRLIVQGVNHDMAGGTNIADRANGYVATAEPYSVPEAAQASSEVFKDFASRVVQGSRAERSFSSSKGGVSPEDRKKIEDAVGQGDDYARSNFKMSGGTFGFKASEGQSRSNSNYEDTNTFTYDDRKPGSPAESVAVKYDAENGDYYFTYRQVDGDDTRLHAETRFRLDGQTGSELYRVLQAVGDDPAAIRYVVDAVNRDLTPGSDIADRDDVAPLTANAAEQTPQPPDPDDAPTAQTGGGGGQPPVPPKPPKNPNGTPDPNKPNDPNDPNNANAPTQPNQAPNAGKRMPGDLPPGFKDMDPKERLQHLKDAYQGLVSFAADMGIKGRDLKPSLSATPRPTKEQRERPGPDGQPRPEGELMVERLKEGIDAYLKVQTFFEMNAYKKDEFGQLLNKGDDEKKAIPVEKLLDLIKGSGAITPESWLMRPGDGRTYQDQGFERGPSGEKLPIRNQDVASRVVEHESNLHRFIHREGHDETGSVWYVEANLSGKYAGNLLKAEERIFFDSNGNKMRADECTDQNEVYTPAYAYEPFIVKNTTALDENGAVQFKIEEVEGRSPIDGSPVTFKVRMPLERKLAEGEKERVLGRDPNEDQLLEDIIFFQKQMWSNARGTTEQSKAFIAVMRMPLDLRSPVITRNYDLIRQLRATDMISNDPDTMRYAKQIQDNIIGAMQKRLTMGRTMAESMADDPAYWDAVSRRIDGVDPVGRPDGNPDRRGYERGGKKDKDGNKPGGSHETDSGSLDKLLEQFQKPELTAEDFDKLDELLRDMRDKMVVRAQDYNRSLLARTEQPDDDEQQRRSSEDTAYADRYSNSLLGLRKIFVVRHNAGLQAHDTFYAEDKWKELVEDIEQRGSYIGDHEEGDIT